MSFDVFPLGQSKAVRTRAFCSLLLLGLAGPSCESQDPAGPQVDGIEPSRVPLGQSTAATIRGHNFRTKLRVEVDSRKAPKIGREFEVWLGANALPSDTVSYVDELTLTITVPSTLALGSYDLGIRTPTGQWGRLQNALTVFDPSTTTGARAGSGGSAATGATLAASGAGSPANIAGAGGIVVGSEGGIGVSSGGAVSATDALAAGAGGTPSSSAAGGFATATGSTTGGQAAGSAGEASAASKAGAGGMSALSHPTLWTDGRLLRDTCGNLLVLRGVQQILADRLPLDNDWAGLMDQIAATGANAIRLQADTGALGINDVDAVLARLASHNMVAVLNPSTTAWFAGAGVKSMLAKYTNRLVLDVYGPGYDDRARFVTAAKAAVAQVRGYGYEVPLVVLSNNYGRDLPAALNYGAEIIAADPLHNTILGWDAYWGSSNWYQKLYGMSLAQGLAASAASAFPIQVGLILETDPGETLDYETAMTAAQANQLGWLWWDWYNPNNQTNNLSSDGTSTNLRTVGERVVNTHPGGLARTATKPCSSQ